MQALEDEIKALIIDALNLEDIVPEDINASAPLFGEGLGVDSIDALELGLALHKRYGVSMSSNPEETRRDFASVDALVSFVSAGRTR